MSRGSASAGRVVGRPSSSTRSTGPDATNAVGAVPVAVAAVAAIPNAIDSAAITAADMTSPAASTSAANASASATVSVTSTVPAVPARSTTSASTQPSYQGRAGGRSAGSLTRTSSRSSIFREHIRTDAHDWTSRDGERERERERERGRDKDRDQESNSPQRSSRSVSRAQSQTHLPNPAPTVAAGEHPTTSNTASSANIAVTAGRGSTSGSVATGVGGGQGGQMPAVRVGAMAGGEERPRGATTAGRDTTVSRTLSRELASLITAAAAASTRSPLSELPPAHIHNRSVANRGQRAPRPPTIDLSLQQQQQQQQRQEATRAADRAAPRGRLLRGQERVQSIEFESDSESPGVYDDLSPLGSPDHLGGWSSPSHSSAAGDAFAYSYVVMRASRSTVDDAASAHIRRMNSRPTLAHRSNSGVRSRRSSSFGGTTAASAGATDETGQGMSFVPPLPRRHYFNPSETLHRQIATVSQSPSPRDSTASPRPTLNDANALSRSVTTDSTSTPGSDGLRAEAGQRHPGHGGRPDAVTPTGPDSGRLTVEGSSTTISAERVSQNRSPSGRSSRSVSTSFWHKNRSSTSGVHSQGAEASEVFEFYGERDSGGRKPAAVDGTAVGSPEEELDQFVAALQHAGRRPTKLDTSISSDQSDRVSPGSPSMPRPSYQFHLPRRGGGHSATTSTATRYQASHDSSAIAPMPDFPSFMSSGTQIVSAEMLREQRRLQRRSSFYLEALDPSHRARHGYLSGTETVGAEDESDAAMQMRRSSLYDSIALGRPTTDPGQRLDSILDRSTTESGMRERVLEQLALKTVTPPTPILEPGAYGETLIDDPRPEVPIEDTPTSYGNRWRVPEASAVSSHYGTLPRWTRILYRNSGLDALDSVMAGTPPPLQGAPHLRRSLSATMAALDSTVPTTSKKSDDVLRKLGDLDGPARSMSPEERRRRRLSCERFDLWRRDEELKRISFASNHLLGLPQSDNEDSGKGRQISRPLELAGSETSRHAHFDLPVDIVVAPPLGKRPSMDAVKLGSGLTSRAKSSPSPLSGGKPSLLEKIIYTRRMHDRVSQSTRGGDDGDWEDSALWLWSDLHNRHPSVRYVRTHDDLLARAADARACTRLTWLFVFGWLFPPLWFVGAFDDTLSRYYGPARHDVKDSRSTPSPYGPSHGRPSPLSTEPMRSDDLEKVRSPGPRRGMRQVSVAVHSWQLVCLCRCMAAATICIGAAVAIILITLKEARAA